MSRLEIAERIVAAKVAKGLKWTDIEPGRRPGIARVGESDPTALNLDFPSRIRRI